MDKRGKQFPPSISNGPRSDYTEVGAVLGVPQGNAWSTVSRYLQVGAVERRLGPRTGLVHNQMAQCVVRIVHIEQNQRGASSSTVNRDHTRRS